MAHVSLCIFKGSIHTQESWKSFLNLEKLIFFLLPWTKRSRSKIVVIFPLTHPIRLILQVSHPNITYSKDQYILKSHESLSLTSKSWFFSFAMDQALAKQNCSYLPSHPSDSIDSSSFSSKYHIFKGSIHTQESWKSFLNLEKLIFFLLPWTKRSRSKIVVIFPLTHPIRLILQVSHPNITYSKDQYILKSHESLSLTSKSWFFFFCHGPSAREAKL
jgi:hypothetical protein